MLTTLLKDAALVGLIFTVLTYAFLVRFVQRSLREHDRAEGRGTAQAPHRSGGTRLAEVLRGAPASPAAHRSSRPVARR